MDTKIKVTNPVVEMDGDEMTRVFAVLIIDYLGLDQGVSHHAIS